jgi:hypothetical protein
MEGFKRLSEENLSILEPKSNNKVMLFLRLNNIGYISDMVEVEELKGYKEGLLG